MLGDAVANEQPPKLIRKDLPADRTKSSTTVHEVRVREDVWPRSAAQEFKDRPRFPPLKTDR